MHHEADVRFVDSHPERDRGAHHPHVVAQEHLLVARPFFGLEAGVIRLRCNAVCVQLGRDRVRRFPARAINDATFVRPGLQEIEAVARRALISERPGKSGWVGQSWRRSILDRAT